jgi:predicted amidophosphoribosyltransferase
MPQIYLHFFGNESSESLLEAYGVVTKNQQQSHTLRPKQCPNCNEPNKPDSRFCAKCRLVLSYDAYNETLEEQKEKDDRLVMLEERMNKQQSMLEKLVEYFSGMKDQNQLNQTAKILFKSGILSSHLNRKYP